MNPVPAETPYISLVVAARYDDHGSNFMRRMQAFLNAFIEQCRKHRLPAEIVIAEWNPLPDRCGLAQALEWPTEGMEWCQVRFIEVPPEIHARYEHSSKQPLYQMIAKNVAIRRARGEWILATNIDIFFNNELMSFLAQRRLDRTKMYRIDRHDTGEAFPLWASADDQLAYCKQNVLRISARDATFELDQFGRRADSPSLSLADHIAMWMRNQVPWLHGLLARPYRRAAGLTDTGMPALHGTVVPRLANNRLFVHLHTNACGDFTLLHRDAWQDLRGYPEFDAYSMNIDSVLCWTAHYAGYREELLANPMRIYHMEHGHGSGWTPEGAQVLYKRIQKAGLPWLEYSELMNWVESMHAWQRPILFNGENWGLVGDTLRETGPALGEAYDSLRWCKDDPESPSQRRVLSS